LSLRFLTLPFAFPLCAGHFSMSCLSSTFSIPSISISPAPEQDPIKEPFSPFSALPVRPSNQDGFRSSHLTPPTSITSFKRSYSPLNPVPAIGQGLENQKFQVLLAASKQRKVPGGSNQSVEFRKEIAMKAHKNRHADRRALFLSKLEASPSPAAMMTPETLLDSPAVFHCSPPPSGLESPRAPFNSWSGNHANDDTSHTWVEHVDFRLVDEQPKPSLNSSSPKSVGGTPSLDQISARLIPRPAKLDDAKMDVLANEDLPRPSIGIGRLRMPLRTQVIHSDNQPRKATPSRPLPSSLSPEPCTKTFVIPRSRSTDSNLTSLNSRDQRTLNMLFTSIKRRLSSEFNSTSAPIQVEMTA